MPLERPESGWRWLHVTDGDGVELVAVSDVETYWAHWVRTPGRGGQALRCVARESGACAWCGVGTSPRARYVLAVRRCSDQQLLLLELGRVQYTWLEVWEQRGMVGTRFRARKSWRGRNAPIELVYQGREHVSAEETVAIADYVALLGMDQLRLMVPPARTIPSEAGGAGIEQPPGGAASAPNGRSLNGADPEVQRVRDVASSQWKRRQP